MTAWPTRLNGTKRVRLASRLSVVEREKEKKKQRMLGGKKTEKYV